MGLSDYPKTWQPLVLDSVTSQPFESMATSSICPREGISFGGSRSLLGSRSSVPGARTFLESTGKTTHLEEERMQGAQDVESLKWTRDKYHRQTLGLSTSPRDPSQPR